MINTCNWALICRNELPSYFLELKKLTTIGITFKTNISEN